MAIPRVVVLGGGFAGLETAFMLRMTLGPAVDLTVVSDQPSFLFKPNTIYIPFGAGEDSLRIPLRKPLHRQEINFHQRRVAGLDPDARRVELEDGTTIAYDFAGRGHRRRHATGRGAGPRRARVHHLDA